MRMTNRLRLIIPTILEEGDYNYEKLLIIINEDDEVDYTIEEIDFVCGWIWKKLEMWRLEN